MGDLFGLAWSNMRRARWRLLMTTAGVVFGTTAVILLVALTIGLQQIAESGIGSNTLLTQITVLPSELSTFDENRPELDDGAVSAIESMDGVVGVLPLLAMRGRGELHIGELRNYPTTYGAPLTALTQMEISASSGALGGEGVIYGANLPTGFFDPEEDGYTPQTIDVFSADITLHFSRFDGESQDIDLLAAAVLAPDDRFDNALLLPVADVQRYNAWLSAEDDIPEPIYDQVFVRTANRDVTNGIEEAILGMGYTTDSIGDVLSDLNSFFVTMRLVLGATGGIALLVAAFVVANTMMMSVLERTSEIGLMKAIGARNSDILLIFLAEAGFVGFVGGAVGVGFALFLATRVNEALLTNPDLSSLGMLPINPELIQGEIIVIPTDLALFAILLATLVGVIAGLLPALRAARMSPVTALKV